MQLERIERGEFINRYFDYQPGEHVTFIEPTQGGKTQLACQLLETIHGDIPVTMLVMKPRDHTPAYWTGRLGYKEVPRWPPPPRFPWQRKPDGYTLWPKQTLTDIDADNEHLRDEFRKALLHAYSAGDHAVFADEVYGLVAELSLEKELTAIWTRGSGMGAGLWAATQKPSGTQGKAIPTFMYSASTHLFLGKDTDKRNTDRFGEIGGVDPKEVSETVRHLHVNKVIGTDGKAHHISDKLYINKNGPYMCLVGP
jgi:hypothetical protein